MPPRRWAQWLAEEMCPTETNRHRLAAALRRRCRSEKVELPSVGQVERVVASGCRRFDDGFAATTAGRLLDILKDTAFITDFTDSFTSVASREVLGRATRPKLVYHRRNRQRSSRHPT